MQPLKLRLRYFGPYKDELIDFEKLTGTSVFLVSGNTGSGKTTIFDAMCYALFGQTTNDQDRDATALRSDFAPADRETSVTLTFRHQGHTYQITRKPKQELRGRGNKIVEHGTKVSLIYPLDSPEPKEITKIGPSNQFIEELLNMTRDQFKQIVMLPQGKFRQFLESSSSDKETLLRDLFNTHFYEQWAQLLKSQLADQQNAYKETLAKLTTIKSGIADVDEELNTTDWLEKVAQKIQHQQERINDISREITTKQEIVTGLNDRVSHEQALIEAFHEQQQTEQKMAELQRQTADIQKVQEQVDQLNWYQQHQKMYFDYQSLQHELQQQRDEQTQLRDQLKKYQAKQDHLKQLTQQLQDEEPAVEQIRERVGLLKDRLPQYSQITKLEQVMQEQAQQVTSQQTTLERDQHSIDEAKGRLKEIATKLAQYQDLTNQQLAVANRRHQFETSKDRMDDLEQREKRQRKLSGQLRTLQLTLHEEQEPLEKAKTEYERLKDAHARSEIARLAQDLKPGAPCPICGSTSHPHPAQVATDQKVITEEEVEAANQKLDQLLEQKAARQSRLREWQDQEKQAEKEQQKQLAQLVSELQIQVANLADAKSELAHFEKTLIDDEDDLTKQQREQQRLKEEQVQLQHRLDVDSQQLAQLQATLNQQKLKLAATKANYQTTRQGLQQEFADEKAARQQLTKWQEQVTDFQKRQQKYQEQQSTNRERLKTTRQSLIELQQAISTGTDQLTAQHHHLEELLMEYSPTLDWQFWSWAMNRLDSLPSLRKQVQHYQDEHTRLESLLHRLKDQIGDRKLPNIEDSKHQLGKAQQELAEVQQQSGEAISELTATKKVYSQVKKLTQQQSAQIARVQNLQTVSDVMNGNTANKLSLERYVLQNYLNEVLRVANERLAKLTNGRYAFKLSDEEAKGNGTKWSGLEINVYDDNAGQERSVRTLSGGESFIASLALALGLGEVIQERSGGIQVETLFIDEGFGSLDQEALDQAMSALQTIRGYKMIGIISHVTELESQIPDQLRVISRNGVSHVEYRHEIDNL